MPIEKTQDGSFHTVTRGLRYRLKQPIWYPYEAALILHLASSPEEASENWRECGICAFRSIPVLEHFRMWGMIESWRITTEANDRTKIEWRCGVQKGIPLPGGIQTQPLDNMREGAFTEVHIEGGEPRPPLEWIECYLEFPRDITHLHPLILQTAQSNPRTSTQRQQEEAILAALFKLGHDPLNLKLYPNGKGKPGPKADVRKLIGKKMTNTVFEKAWERLKKFEDIKESD